MFFRILTFLFIFSVLYSDESVSQKPIPVWVKPQDALQSLATSDTTGSKLLLNDCQENLNEKTTYSHFAYKIATQIDVEKMSELHIDFDPTFEKLIIHEIRLNRNGKWLGRRDSLNMLVKNENNLGPLTLIYLLDDVQLYDIVDYSYSIIGHHPNFSLFSSLSYLQSCFSTEHFFYRVIGNKDLYFQIKGIDLEPKIVDIAPNLREWNWETFKTPAYTKKEGAPVWYNPQPHVLLSEYKNWQAMIKEIMPLYELPEDFASLEMKELVLPWMGLSLEGRAVKALRFVQDEVRYLSISEGTHYYKPYEPKIVFKRRFGDCKDKAFLLHALLKLMNIDSTVVLVNSSNPKMLEDAIPTIADFDHVILQIEIEGQIYYVDPTNSYQGGPLSKIFLRNFEYGLVLKDGTDLTPLPKSDLETPKTIESSFILTESVDLNINTTASGHDADELRYTFKACSEDDLKNYCLSFIQKTFQNAAIKSFSFLDDRERNIIKISECYSLNIPEGEGFLPFISFIKSSGLNYINPNSPSPHVLTYPLWIKEHIRIENPSSSSAAGKYTASHEVFLFNFSMDKNNNGTDYYLELKNLQDHVPQELLQSYSEQLEEIADVLPIEIVVR